LLLIRRSMRGEQRADQFEQTALIGDRRITPGELLHRQRVAHDIHSRAAERGGHGDAEQADPSHLLIDLGGIKFVPVQCLRLRPDDVIGEAPRGPADFFMTV
jgi:hypothetical protein